MFARNLEISTVNQSDPEKTVYVKDEYLPGESEVASKDFPVTEWQSTWRSDHIHVALVDGPYGRSICLWDGVRCVSRKRPEDFRNLSWMGWRGVTLDVIDDTRNRMYDGDAKAAVLERHVTLGTADATSIATWVQSQSYADKSVGEEFTPPSDTTESISTDRDEGPIGILVLEVCHALKAGCYSAALWVALSLPDICSKAERINGTSSLTSYAKWFNNWVRVNQHAHDCQSTYNGHQLTIQDPTFDGMACYTLRCRVFHNGDAKIDDKYQTGGQQHPKNIHVGEFSLEVGPDFLESRTPVIDGWSLGNNPEDERISVNLIWLCVALCDAALRCYRESKYKAAYKESYIPLSIQWPAKHGSKSVEAWVSEFGLRGYC